MTPVSVQVADRPFAVPRNAWIRPWIAWLPGRDGGPAVIGLCGAFLALIVMGVMVRTQGIVALHQSDAQHYYRVAVDPFGNGSIFDNAPPGSGISYRYGRIGFPLLAWLLAFGQPAGIAVTLPLVYLAGIWLLVTLASEACARAERPAAGLLVLLMPYAWCMGPVMVPEFLVAGLLLLMYRSVEREQWPAAYATACLLLLVRETAVLALVPLAWTALRQKRYAAVLAWGVTAIPLLLWYGWVRSRIGAWPFADPLLALPQYRAFDWPVRGFLAMAWAPESRIFLRLVAIVAWMTLALTGWQLRRTPTSLVAQGAVAMGVLVLVFGSLQSVNPGEVLRILLPAQILFVVAYVSNLQEVAGCRTSQLNEQTEQNHTRPMRSM